MVRIGFDISQTGNSKAGCGFFSENLILNLAKYSTENQYILYPTFGDHFWDQNYNNTCRIYQSNFSYGLKHSSLNQAKFFWEHFSDESEKKLGTIDIVHANNFFCPPNMMQAKLIYTLYDLSFIEHPEYSTEHNRIACFDGIFKASLHADLIIAISHFSREHFLKTFPHYPADKIVVVHPASRFSHTNKELTKSKKLDKLTNDQFWLSVGTLEPRKNIKLLLKTYADLKSKQPTLPLVLAGKQGWMIDHLEEILRDLNLTEDVHVLGYVDDEELKWLYQNCFCLIYPSLFEGFGLPILEAMTLGAPVITSNVSSIPEVIGSAGIMVNPTDSAELMAAMMEVASNAEYRQKMKSLSIQQSLLFSWENTAKKVSQLYNEVAFLPKRVSLL